MTNFVNGTAGIDNLSGLPDEANVINTMEGNDFLQGGTMPDLLLGGADNDTLFGGDGDDQLSGDGQIVGPVSTQDVIVNGGFEMALTNWTPLTQGDGVTNVLSGTDSGVSMHIVAAPTEGGSHVVFDENGPSAHALLQTFTVPFTVPMGVATTVFLNFDLFVDNTAGGVANVGGDLNPQLNPQFDPLNPAPPTTPNQHMRVDLLTAGADPWDTGAGVVVNLYDGGSINQHFSIDVSAYIQAGQTYQLRFAEVNNQGYQPVAIDAVSLYVTSGIQDVGTGNDVLIGGLGNDSLSGGLGVDLAVYNGLWRDYTVKSYASSATVTGPDGADVLVGVELLGFNGNGVSVAIADAVNDNPIGVDDTNSGDAVIEASSSVVGDALATGNVLSNDLDADDALSLGETRAVSSVNGQITNVGSSIVGTYGSVVINADGTYTYTLDNNDVDTEALITGQVVNDNFSYTVMDAHGATGETTLSISIAGTTDNAPPALTGSLAALTGSEDSAFNFTQVQLLEGYTDANGDTLSVSSLSSTAGSLVDNGDGTYTLTPAADFNGTIGLSYNVIDGNGGSVAASNSVNFVDAPERIVINSGVTYTLATGEDDLVLTGTSNINGTGNSLDNMITGNSGNNILDGKVGADTLIGGLGNDTYYVDNIGDVVTENVGQGADIVYATLDYTLAANVENLGLQGTANINGTGNELNNTLTGNSGNNSLSGGLGNDFLNGDLGADTMIGGVGGDTYRVDNVGDVVTELSGEGADVVQSSISYVLAVNVESLVLLGGAINLNGTGNGLNNTIVGNTGNNALNGGLGADYLQGGLGNDTYSVDNVGDVVTEGLAGGTDIVNSTISYSLLANVENLGLQGAANINGTGNELNNSLTGNSGNNSLIGALGNDFLNGGLGADTMIGGVGGDTYRVDNVGDVVTELSGEGADIVQSTLSYVLGGSIESLVLLGVSDLNGTGNGLNNTIVGNTGNNVLSGGLGADYLQGGLGNDTYNFGRGDGQDAVVDNSGTADVVSFLSGVSRDQLWFKHSGNNLEVSIIGTTDKVTVKNWYVGGTVNQVEEVHTATGNVLISSQVESLVTAMSSFTPPSVGTTTLDSGTYASVLSAITTSWNS